MKENIDLIPFPYEAFLTQAHADGFVEAATRRNAFAASEYVGLPMVQPYDIPGLGTLYSRALTAREIDVLNRLARGLSMKGTARDLDIALGTVKWHVKNLYGKLGASSRDDALFKARSWQLIK